jgi:predicted unusual protein kinase regulating ubiquinone biosynthesis (AarF/ABC1/UbiB family)
MAERRASRPTRGRVARTARIGRVATAGAIRLAADRLDGRGTEDDQRRRRGDRVVATIDLLVDQLSAMRGAAMKAGQALSTLEFPGLDEAQSAHLQRRLAELRDDIPPVGWKEMRKLMAKEWGAAPDRMLARIDPEPVAAASIGQVYRGRTHEGREVAVKVQYPGIAEVVESDMRSLSTLVPLLRQLKPDLEVKDLIAELRERIAEECDYELEAANHRRLARSWRDHPFIVVPDVVTDLARRRVLVTDWVDGIGYEEVIRSPDAVRDRYVEIIYRFYLGTAAELDLACGDPHPGNYLLRSDGRVAFFDFGMMRTLPAGYLRREAAVSRAVREHNPKARISALEDLGYLPDGCSDEDGRALLARMRRHSAWRRAEEPVRLDSRPGGRRRRRDPAGDDREPPAGDADGQAPADTDGRPTSKRSSGERLRLTLPPEALLLRRMQALLYLTAAKARASVAWGPLHRELLEDGEPLGELGAEHAAWRATHRR